MKILKTMACGLALCAVFMTSACAGSPRADGEKAARMMIEVRDATLKYGYGSDEVKEASERADKFTSECRERYLDDEKAAAEFMDGFNETIKKDMQSPGD